MKKHVFKFPVGDWSDDGHGKCAWYNISSPMTLQEVREVYFNVCSKVGTGFDTHVDEAPCSDYGDHKLSKAWLEKTNLLAFYYSLIDYIPEENREECDKEYDWEEAYEDIISESGDSFSIYDPEIFVKLFIEFMNSNDSAVQLKLESSNDKMFPFYGYDKDGRHIGALGYGLFD